MKKSVTLALNIAIVLGTASTQADVLYLVDDIGLNNSQFLMKEANNPIIPLGVPHESCDIEALDIHEGNLYAAAGDDTPRAGHLYQVDKENGDLSDLGVIGGEIDGISFHPGTGDLWGWSQCQGLFVVQASDIPDQGVPMSVCEKIPTVPSIPSELIFERKVEIEDIKWNEEGNILYAVENVHPGLSSSCQLQGGEPDNGDEDPHEGVRLWAYDAQVGSVQAICNRELTDMPEIEGLEILPKETFAANGNQDVLALGFHNAGKLEYLLITPPSPPATDCEMLLQGEIPLVADVEGMAYEGNEQGCIPDVMKGVGKNMASGDGKTVSYNFQVYCGTHDSPNNFLITWGSPKNRFKLDDLTKAVCSNDPQINEYPPEAGFDTYEGEGKGKLNDKEATIKFKFTDGGGPDERDFGPNDKIVYLEIIQQGQSVLVIRDKTLGNSDNHQAFGKGDCEGGMPPTSFDE